MCEERLELLSGLKSPVPSARGGWVVERSRKDKLGLEGFRKRRSREVVSRYDKESGVRRRLYSRGDRRRMSKKMQDSVDILLNDITGRNVLDNRNTGFFVSRRCSKFGMIRSELEQKVYDMYEVKEPVKRGLSDKLCDKLLFKFCIERGYLVEEEVKSIWKRIEDEKIRRSEEINRFWKSEEVNRIGKSEKANRIVKREKVSRIGKSEEVKLMARVKKIGRSEVVELREGARKYFLRLLVLHKARVQFRNADIDKNGGVVVRIRKKPLFPYKLVNRKLLFQYEYGLEERMAKVVAAKRMVTLDKSLFYGYGVVDKFVFGVESRREEERIKNKKMWKVLLEQIDEEMFMIRSGSKLKAAGGVKRCVKSIGSKPEEDGAVGKESEESRRFKFMDDVEDIIRS